MELCLRIRIDTPGLERAIRDGAHEIASAILALDQPPQITGGLMTLDPQPRVAQGAPLMATAINKALPQHISVLWTGTAPDGSTVPVTPDSVDYEMSDLSLGTLTADAVTPTAGATFQAAAGIPAGPIDVTFHAVSHQAGLADFPLSVDGTLVDVAPPGVQISGGSMTLDPQPATTRRAPLRR